MTFFTANGSNAVSQRRNGAKTFQAWVFRFDCVTNGHCDFAVLTRICGRIIRQWIRTVNKNIIFIFCGEKYEIHEFPLVFCTSVLILTFSEFKWTTESIAEINGNVAFLQVTELMELNAAIDFFTTWTDGRISGIVVFIIANTFIAWRSGRINEIPFHIFTSIAIATR